MELSGWTYVRGHILIGITMAISIDVLILLRNYCNSMSEEAEREEIKEETDELRDSEEDEYEDNDVVKEE